MEQAALDIMTAALKEQRYTGREILNLMSEKTDIIQSYLLLLMLWQNGLTCRLP